MRGTRHGAFDAVHVVSAWSKQQGITLCALETKSKSNEITTIPSLLGLIDVKNAVVTTDAMGCQRDIALKIRDGGGHYALQIKGNQKRLYTEIQAYHHKLQREEFGEVEHQRFEEVDKGHGRIEQRATHHVALNSWVTSAENWCDAKSYIRVERKRITPEKESCEVSWYLSSLDIDAARAANAVRSHWEVENKLHWRLDVIFREDEYRAASSAMTMAVIKRFCMNLLKLNDTSKRRMKHRVMAAAIDDDYRTKVLLSG